MKDIIYINNYPYFTKNIKDIYPKFMVGKIYIAMRIKYQTSDGELILVDRGIFKDIDEANLAIKELLELLELMEYDICEV